MYRAHSVVILVVSVCMAYAITRYIIFGPISVEQIPLFVVNKAVAFASILLLAISFALGPLLRLRAESAQHPLHPRRLGTAGFFLAVAHSVVSVSLLNPGYFAKFFHSNGTMTWQAESSLLASVLALGLLLWQARLSNSVPRTAQAGHSPGAGGDRFPRYLGLGVLALTCVHVTLMGHSTWLAPDRWHGGMPPITLMALIVAVFAVLLRFVTGRYA